MLAYIRKCHHCIGHTQIFILSTDLSYILYFGHKQMWLRRLELYFSLYFFGFICTLQPHPPIMNLRPIFSLNSSFKILASPLYIGNRHGIYKHMHTIFITGKKNQIKNNPRSTIVKLQVPFSRTLFPSQGHYFPAFLHICGSCLAKIPPTMSVS